MSEDCGKKLRPSRFSTGSVNTLPLYLLPEEVRAASSDELAEYFKPERERKAARDAERRAKLRREREQEKEQALLILALNEQREKVLAITQSVELPAETSGGIVIDTETTGLCAGEDEILQLSIISESGEKLFDSYFRPLHKSWSAAQAVNNISPDIVANAPSIADKAAEIQRILNSADTIIGYNTSFDADFIKDNINPNLEICGILETMTDNTQMAQAVDKALKERYGGLVYETTISKRIEAANSTAEQKSLISKKNSVLGGQYRELVTEILSKEAI